MSMTSLAPREPPGRSRHYVVMYVRCLGLVAVAGVIGGGGCFGNAPVVEGETAAASGDSSGPGTGGTTSSTGGTTTASAGPDDAGDGTTTQDPSSSGATAHADSGGDTDASASDGTGHGGTSGDATTGDSSSGGGFDFGCIDEDLGMAIGLGVTDGNTNGADDSYAPTCVAGDAPDRVLLWTAPADGTYSFSTIGSGYDTGLAVLSGDCSGIEIACNDDSSPTIVQSDVSIALEEGQTIAIVVDGYEGASGAFTLTIASR
ncbi:MAG: hypothetical protein IPH07_20915 [Deltaproteobacteria bacterium]|nr:hypothetical protein [Deltaproteobacteria bacterium]MBK8716178.1 hypothetical protein [Deltaproteobacteria bacterium]MBP7289462.1 hypothetical protein [Nannocystaceae bacterium]